MTDQPVARSASAPAGVVCYGVAAGHLARSDVQLYRIGMEPGRRAFLCDGCRDALLSIGMRVQPLEDERDGVDRRRPLRRRATDLLLGQHGHDRRLRP